MKIGRNFSSADFLGSDLFFCDVMIKCKSMDRNTQKISEMNVPPAALFGDDLNQAYFDNLYARIASHMENKMNWLYNQLAKN